MRRGLLTFVTLLFLAGCGDGDIRATVPSPRSVTSFTTVDGRTVRSRPKPQRWPSWIPRHLRRWIDRGSALDDPPLYRRGCRNLEVLPPRPRSYEGEYVITARSRSTCGQAIRLTLALDRTVRSEGSRCRMHLFCANPTAFYDIGAFTCTVVVVSEGSDLAIRCNRDGRQIVHMAVAG